MFWCIGGAGGVENLGEPSGLLPPTFLAHYECSYDLNILSYLIYIRYITSHLELKWQTGISDTASTAIRTYPQRHGISIHTARPFTSPNAGNCD